MDVTMEFWFHRETLIRCTGPLAKQRWKFRVEGKKRKYAVITKYIDTDTAVKVPREIAGHPVKEISYNAFYEAPVSFGPDSGHGEKAWSRSVFPVQSAGGNPPSHLRRWRRNDTEDKL